MVQNLRAYTMPQLGPLIPHCYVYLLSFSAVQMPNSQVLDQFWPMSYAGKAV